MKKRLEEILDFEKMVKNGDITFIGSSALNVENRESDFDICLRIDSLNPFSFNWLNDNFSLLPIEKYFDVVPKEGGFLILKADHSSYNKPIDIIFLHHADYIAAIRAITTLKSFPKYILEDKDLRVRLYEKAWSFELG